MAHQIHRNNIGSCMLFFIAFVRIWSNGIACGSRVSARKTIQVSTWPWNAIYFLSLTDGLDVIHCVDLYKQPAFDHPLLKNHTIQMKPSSFPRGGKPTKSPKILQRWFKNGECPQGTIPILRTQAFNRLPVKPLIPNRTDCTPPPPSHEVSIAGAVYLGARAAFNVWTPIVAAGEFSTAQMWILSGDGEDLNSVESGWEADPDCDEVRFFIHWTKDNYKSTGCFNLDCPGFVQVNRMFALGYSLAQASTTGGNQYEIDVVVHKDTFSGHWWLTLQNEEVGYWPGNIFSSLSDSSNLINFGGHVMNNQAKGRHTITQMGSGGLPSEGFGKAAYIGHLSYVDSSSVLRDATDLQQTVSRPECYDLTVGKEEPSIDQGIHVYYGGPGLSDQCQ